jgi:hypothetical protein
MDASAQPQPGCRLDEKFLQLLGSLIVAPIADPDEIDLLGDTADRTEQGGVGRFMPSEDAVAPATAPIDLTQDFAEDEKPIVIIDIEALELVRRRYGAMMSVMEQEREGSAVPPPLAEPGDKLRRAPLVHDDDVSAIEGGIEIKSIGRIGVHPHVRHKLRCFRQNGLAAVLQRIAAAPAVSRLIDTDLMTAACQLAGDPAQEMRVAVIPAGCERVIEQDELHAAISTA